MLRPDQSLSPSCPQVPGFWALEAPRDHSPGRPVGLRQTALTPG